MVNSREPRHLCRDLRPGDARAFSQRTQSIRNARKAVGLDASDDEKWLATELDFLSILVDVLKGLKRSNGSE